MFVIAGPSGRGLRCRSAGARLLRLWVRIPPGAWMFVPCECCVLSGRCVCDKLITRPEESYRLWSVVVCDLETSWMRWPWLTRGGVGCCAQKKVCNYCGHWILNTDARSSVVQEGYWVWESHKDCCCQLSTFELTKDCLFAWHCVEQERVFLPKSFCAQLVLFSSASKRLWLSYRYCHTARRWE